MTTVPPQSYNLATTSALQSAPEHSFPFQEKSCPSEAQLARAAVIAWRNVSSKTTGLKGSFLICRPSPYHLAMPPRRSCGAESYSAGPTEIPAGEGLRITSAVSTRQAS
jgi:hypothetical protein